MQKHEPVRLEDVKKFWNENPLCASAIPHPLGSKEYFQFYDGLREQNESLEFSYKLHEYKAFANKKVLDVGSGNGYVLSKYAREGADVYGVDITETGIDLCKKRFEILGLKGNFQVANAEQLPFPDETFDCVCSMGVLHHVPDTEKAVSEVHRVLKKGGRLIVMFYHKDSALYRFKMPIQRLTKGKSVAQLVDEVDGIGNPKGDVYTKKELGELLKKFTNLDMFVGLLSAWMVFPFGGRFVPEGLLKPFEKSFGWFLYAKGNKPQ